MIIINPKPKLVAIFLVLLTISMPAISNPMTGKSRATKIISLTQESENDNKESKIEDQSKSFIDDLREKYPHFSEDQLQSMKRAYEDTILENVTGAQIEGEKKQTEKDLEIKTTPTKKKLQSQLSQLVNENTKKDKSEASKEIKQEAESTVVSLTVKRGDTLSDIARRTYGDPDMYIAIYEENKDKLRSPSSVPEGVTLKVPKITPSMKTQLAKMKRDYENSVAKEKSSKRKAKEEARKQARKEARENKKEREKQAKHHVEKRNKVNSETHRSMAELERLILEGKY